MTIKELYEEAVMDGNENAKILIYIPECLDCPSENVEVTESCMDSDTVILYPW